MKNKMETPYWSIATLLLTLLTIPSVFAEGNEGPDPAPEPPTTTSVLIEKVTQVGFAPPEYAGTYSVQIHLNGKVLSKFEGRTGKVRIKNLGMVSPRVVRNIKKQLREAFPSSLPVAVTLVDSSPEIPMCYDAPTTTWQGYLTGPGPAEFQRVHGCHLFSLSPTGYAAEPLINILDGFDNLSK